MLKIKLFPRGKKHQRTYRIVVAESRTKSNGKVTADIGFVTPQTKTVQVNREALEMWIKNGAQMTLGVDKVLNPEKYVRPAKVKPVKEAEVEESAPAETPTEA